MNPKQYLESMQRLWLQGQCQPMLPEGARHQSLFEFWLAHGIEFTGDVAICLGGKAKECYKNATHAALESGRELTYCEGWAFGPNLPVPIEHAWCVNQQGMIFELTWKPPGGSNYFGVPFKTEYLERAVLSAGYYGLVDAYFSRWPLMFLDPEEWLEYGPGVQVLQSGPIVQKYAKPGE